MIWGRVVKYTDRGDTTGEYAQTRLISTVKSLRYLEQHTVIPLYLSTAHSGHFPRHINPPIRKFLNVTPHTLKQTLLVSFSMDSVCMICLHHSYICNGSPGPSRAWPANQSSPTIQLQHMEGPPAATSTPARALNGHSQRTELQALARNNGPRP